MGPIPRKFNWRARNLIFSYLTKQAKRKWRYVHSTTRIFLLDKPHVHFRSYHRHNDSQLPGTHMRASNPSRNINPPRLTHTRWAMISRPILPLKVLTTIEHFPATTTPELKHLLKRAWLSVTKWKQKRDKELKLTQTKHQRSIRKKGASYKSVGFSLVHHRSSQWTRKSPQNSNNHFHRNEPCSPEDTATRRHFPYPNNLRLTMQPSDK